MEITISIGGSSFRYGSFCVCGGLAYIVWKMVALSGDVLSCLSTRCCVMFTLGAGVEISGVFGGGTPTLGRGTATLGRGGKPCSGASVVVY